VHATFAKLNSSADNLQVMTEKLKAKIEDPKLQARVDESLDAFQRTLKNFEEGAAQIKELVSDPQMKSDLQVLLVQARESTQNLKEASDSLKSFATDPQIREDLKSAVHEGKETMATAKEAMSNVRGASDDMKEVMKSARSAADRVNTILGGESKRSLRSSVHTQMTFRNFSQTDQTLSDLSLKIGGTRSFFSTGLSGFGASGVSYTLQKGYGLGDNTATRLGIFRSHPGIGFDRRLGKLNAAIDIYDPNRVRYAGWLGLELNPTFDLMLGIERGANRRDLIGVGLRVRPF
jgi:hypothetical protein